MPKTNQYIKNTKDFIKKAIEKHGIKYDYSLVDYKGIEKKVKILYNDVRILFAVLGANIVDGKDTGKDLIHSLQLSIVSKLSEIHVIQDLIKRSDFYKSGEIKDLIVDR